MPKQNDYTLTEDEQKQIKNAMKNPETRVSKRATVIYNLHQGYKPEEVATLHQISLGTVYNHYNRFKAEGIAGLPDKAKSGRPLKATEEYIVTLEETLETDPHDLGYAFTIWTQARLRQYLAEQTDIKLSRSRFQDLMQRLGYRYRRPKRDLGHEQDSDLREQFIEVLVEVKKQPKREKSSYSLWMKS